jgi:hypothetical protein
MNNESKPVEVLGPIDHAARIPEFKEDDNLGIYKGRVDLSAAEISTLGEFLNKDTMTLDQCHGMIQILGHQWHPQAERTLAECYLRLEDPLSCWAAIAIGSYSTYSSLINIKEIVTRGLENHFTDRVLRSRAEMMIKELERRLAAPEFVQFDIKIARRRSRSSPKYTIETIKSSYYCQDEGESDVFSFSDIERSRIEDFLQNWQKRTMAEAGLSEVGGLLYQKLFGGRLKECLERCLLHSRQDAKFGGVALTLHLADSWLAGLPWSCLYDKARQHFLVRDDDAAIALRLLTERSALRPWDGSRTTRLLVIVSQPDETIRRSLMQAGVGLVDVDTEEERTHFTEGYKKWNRDSDKLLCIDIVRACDDKIFELMSNNHFDYDAVHYFGHCFHDGKDPYLVFEDCRGPRGPLRTSQDVLSLVAKNRGLQIVSLVACQSAFRTPGTAVHRSLAEHFLAAGVPTVVAMQTPIRRSTGLTFARHFYHQLIRTGSASAAFHKALQAITVRPVGNVVEAEWGAPALFVRR